MFIDFEELERALGQSNGPLLTSEAEQLLVHFYHLKSQIEEAEKKIKQKIEEAALKQSPFFSKYSGDHVSIRYQAYGSKYQIDPNHTQPLPDNLVKAEIKYTPIAKEIDAYKMLHKNVPPGIIENHRKKSLSISLRKADPIPDDV